MSLRLCTSGRVCMFSFVSTFFPSSELHMKSWWYRFKISKGSESNVWVFTYETQLLGVTGKNNQAMGFIPLWANVTDILRRHLFIGMFPCVLHSQEWSEHRYLQGATGSYCTNPENQSWEIFPMGMFLAPKESPCRVFFVRSFSHPTHVCAWWHRDMG